MSEHVAGALQYVCNTGGLNNQKWALFGLFLAAQRSGRPLVLPDFCALDPRRNVADRVAIGRVFDLAPLRDFAARHGIAVLDAPPGGEVGGWEHFQAGAARVAVLSFEGRLRSDRFSREFFACLRPLTASSPLFLSLSHILRDELGVDTVAQFRIEQDWAHHIELNRGGDLPLDGEEYGPGFQRIMAKIATTLAPDVKRVLVVCDEDDLPAPKETIRAQALAAHGVELLWKSDLLGPHVMGELSKLDLSIIDFELARGAATFIGLSRSTFSNLAAYEASLERDDRHPRHFLYNAPGDGLVRRWDRGAHSDAVTASNILFGRDPLVAGVAGVSTGGMRLLAHMGGYGDLADADYLAAGAPGGSRIEGFRVETAAGGVALECRGRLGCGEWTAWRPGHEMVGTAGQDMALTGFAARLAGPGAADAEVMCLGRFEGVEEVVRAADGGACTMEPPRALEAMQIVVSRLDQVEKAASIA